MLLRNVLGDGTLNAVIYDFEVKGDELALHTHAENACHYSVLVSGFATLHINGKSIPMVQGKLYKILPGEVHGFTALGPARIINLPYGEIVE